MDWLNLVDADYRGQLRELNELNFARFDAKMGQRLGALETRMLRWMFAFWTGNTIALMAFLYTVLHTH